MNKILEEAIRLSQLGYSTIPITERKNPAIDYWRVYQTRPPSEEECKRNFSNAYGIALLTGGKNKLTVIDFDTKYFTDKELYEDIKKAVPLELLSKMKVAQTQSGGFHWMFKCQKIEPNQKLANRSSLEKEVMKTFAQELDKSGDINQAMKIASNDKCKVMIETRGGTETNCGGYVLIDPTPNYKWIYGVLNEISPEEYDLLMNVMRSFNTYSPSVKNTELAKVDEGDEDNPFIDYNKRGDGVELLEEHGWKVLDIRGRNVRMLRPGQVHSASSGLYDSESKIFNCFSTSTAFEVGKGYSNTDLLMELESLSGSECYKKLTELGYGKSK